MKDGNRKNKNGKDKDIFSDTPCMIPQNGLPENCSEMVNFFGTYNIQQTDNSSNTFPAIGEGLSKKECEKLEKEKERWLREDKTDKGAREDRDGNNDE